MAGVETKTRSSVAGLRLLSLLAALAPGPAVAGAWIAPKGGQEIWTNTAGQRDDLTFYESSAYWEIPVGEHASFVAAPWVEQNYDTVDGWRGEAVVGVKRALFRGEDTVLALQGGALWMSHAPRGCSEGGVEARFLGGHSFDSGLFLNVEAATRALEGGCGGERLDVTAGTRFAGNWMALGQVFVDAPHEGEETIKAQLTLVRFGRSGRGLQIGLRGRIDGGAEENALVLGWWGRPGD